MVCNSMLPCRRLLLLGYGGGGGLRAWLGVSECVLLELGVPTLWISLYSCGMLGNGLCCIECTRPPVCVDFMCCCIRFHVRNDAHPKKQHGITLVEINVSMMTMTLPLISLNQMVIIAMFMQMFTELHAALQMIPATNATLTILSPMPQAQIRTEAGLNNSSYISDVDVIYAQPINICIPCFYCDSILTY